MSKAKVEDYYNAVTETYHQQYERDGVFDTTRIYPSNYFRSQLLINSFLNKDVNRIIEVGIGEGTPLLQLQRAGFDTFGFDMSQSMVDKARLNYKNNGVIDNTSRLFWGDIRDPNTYVSVLKGGKFDGLIAMGVMPHVENDDAVIENMSSMIKPGGTVFIEFRNELFSMFSFNRYTVKFVTEQLLDGVDPKLVELVQEDLGQKLRMDMPPVRDVLPDGSPDYDAILSKFHNPLNIHELFHRHGFKNIKLHWYHYHPVMPYMHDDNKELIRKEAVKMEHEPSGWKGYFLCSAFVVEADK